MAQTRPAAGHRPVTTTPPMRASPDLLPPARAAPACSVPAHAPAGRRQPCPCKQRSTMPPTAASHEAWSEVEPRPHADLPRRPIDDAAGGAAGILHLRGDVGL